MSAINEAYRVLSDPGRRVQYDRSLRGGSSSAAPSGASSAAPGGSTAEEWVRSMRAEVPADLQPARVPWRMLSFFGVLAIGLVLLGAVLFEPAPEREPVGILRPGSCVALEPNGDAREIRCSESADLIVEELVPSGRPCPVGTAPHRDRQGLGTACLRRQTA
jgi:molecular chaperone DnaJ